jgi:DNA repair exonuclease SbcCD ATPase subunit
MAISITEQTNIETLATMLHNADSRLQELQAQKQELETQLATLQAQKADIHARIASRKSEVEQAKKQHRALQEHSVLLSEESEAAKGTALEKERTDAWAETVFSVNNSHSALEKLQYAMQEQDEKESRALRTLDGEIKKIEVTLHNLESPLLFANRSRADIFIQLDAARREDFRIEIEALHEEFAATSLHLDTLQEKLDALSQRARNDLQPGSFQEVKSLCTFRDDVTSLLESNVAYRKSLESFDYTLEFIQMNGIDTRWLSVGFNDETPLFLRQEVIEAIEQFLQAYRAEKLQ